jgi:hypothetical protein
MQSMLKPTESDPHDVFAVAPGIVPAAWADKVLADITRDAGSVPQVKPVHAESSASGAPVPNVDITFRASAAADSRIPDIDVANDRPAPPPGGSRTKSTIIAFLFALCSALAAAGWQHYGVAARQMIAAWTPPFALTSLQSTEPTGLPGRADTPAVEVPSPASAQAAAPASTEDQAAPAPAQAEGAAPAAAPSTDAAQLRSMARDLATMGQEVELLKATVAELKASQQPALPAVDAGKPSQAKMPAPKPAAANPQARMPAPPRLAAVSPRRPVYPAPAYPAQTYPAQTYPAQAYPPVQAAAPPPPPQQLAPPAEAEDGPVIRPPMPLH